VLESTQGAGTTFALRLPNGSLRNRERPRLEIVST